MDHHVVGIVDQIGAAEWDPDTDQWAARGEQGGDRMAEIHMVTEVATAVIIVLAEVEVETPEGVEVDTAGVDLHVVDQ